MNEEDLKAIWKKDEHFPTEKLDFERAERMALDSQKKLQRKIKWDIGLSILTYIIISPVFFYFPKVLVTLPFVTAAWIWYLWEILRIYRHDSDFRKQSNIKSFFVEKKKLLTDYITRTRYIGYLGMPIVMSVCYIGMTSFETLRENPRNFLLCVVFSEILALILYELYIRKIYAPVVDELKDLLQQLDD